MDILIYSMRYLNNLTLVKLYIIVHFVFYTCRVENSVDLIRIHDVFKATYIWE